MQGQPLDFTHLTKNYGSICAVSDLTFTVQPGRVTGFLGPNGAGKTTTLRILLGLVKPTSGSATIGGQKYAAFNHPMTVVGSHLSPDAFNPGRNGRDHLRWVAAGSAIDQDRIEPLLELVGLAKDAGRRIGGYSLGMKQRLGLATALLGDPEVLVLDEPANGLDPEGISWLRGFLRTLAEEGRTVFLSSHLLGEIQLMAHDIVIINHGQLVAAGSVEELERDSERTVLVDSNDRAALLGALRAAGVTVISAEVGKRIHVADASADDLGRIALGAKVPLTHLSEENTGLETLFLSMVGSQS